MSADCRFEESAGSPAPRVCVAGLGNLLGLPAPLEESAGSAGASSWRESAGSAGALRLGGGVCWVCRRPCHLLKPTLLLMLFVSTLLLMLFVSPSRIVEPRPPFVLDGCLVLPNLGGLARLLFARLLVCSFAPTRPPGVVQGFVYFFQDSPIFFLRHLASSLSPRRGFRLGGFFRAYWRLLVIAALPGVNTNPCSNYHTLPLLLLTYYWLRRWEAYCCGSSKEGRVESSADRPGAALLTNPPVRHRHRHAGGPLHRNQGLRRRATRTLEVIRRGRSLSDECCSGCLLC